MSTFEERLWSQLVADHGEQIRSVEWQARSRPSRRRSFAAAALGTACLASAMGVVLARGSQPVIPSVSRAAFVVTDNHDGTVTVTLHRAKAVTALDRRLAAYGLKAKLPRGASVKTLSSLTATCPEFPKLPESGHPLGLSVAGSQHQPLPGRNLHRLKSCVLRPSS